MLTALLLSLSLAAPGDVELLLSTGQSIADANQKQKLGAALVAVFPPADPAKVKNFNCRHQENDTAQPIGCDGWHKVRKTEAQFTDDSIAGEASQALDEGAPEGWADYYKLAKFKLASAAALVEIDAFVVAGFPGLTINDLYQFRTGRNKDDFNEILIEAIYKDEVNDATHATLSKIRAVVKVLGRVP